MVFISATRLHVRTWTGKVALLWHTMRIARQAKRSPGFLGGCLGGDAEGGAWTVTQWQSEAEMRSFRNSGAHMRAMPQLLDLCDEASFGHWTEEQPEAPATMEEAYRRVKSSGRISKVRHPSPAHAGGSTVGVSVPRAQLRLRPR